MTGFFRSLEDHNFYPRSPCGERLLAVQLGCKSFLFLSTLSLRRATCSCCSRWLLASISIHALLAESDFHHSLNLPSRPIISIHALLAESDCYSLRHSAQSRHFYPRSPCGERPFGRRVGLPVAGHFYPRSPCGERRTNLDKFHKDLTFLSTLSLRRATSPAIFFFILLQNFYPRSPCGERPFEKFEGVIATKISIHALLAESDAYTQRI